MRLTLRARHHAKEASRAISETTAEMQHDHTLITAVLNLIPSNIFAAIMRGDMLPIIFFSVFFGLGLLGLPAKTREPLVKVF